MSSVYPLQFRPQFKEYLWGGRRLGEVLDKPIGDGPTYAESWEIVDHGEDQSVVANGPLQGTTLHQLVTEHGRSLLGDSYFASGSPPEQFPLLLKFLDAQKDLSLQVHPDDAYGATLDPPDLGKTEAWVVMHAEPDSVIYAGLKAGFDRDAFARELHRGTGHLCVHQIRPQVGDCVFIPAGVVHAIGAGLLIAEIQQASNTTFRLFDWNRVGADGKPRPLHLEQGLEVTDYDIGPIEPQRPQSTSREFVERLVDCDKFVLDRWILPAEVRETFPVDGRFHIVAVLDGRLTLEHPHTPEPLRRGQVVLLPAERDALSMDIANNTVLLDMWVS